MAEPSEPQSPPAEPTREAVQGDGKVSDRDLDPVSGGCFIPLPLLFPD